jgi:hypothetical protein
MYRKKRRNKRSDDMTDITFKTVVHALRASSFEIPKDVLLHYQLPTPVSSSEGEDVYGSEEDVHDSEEDACGREQDHWNAKRTKRIKCTVIVGHLCWTQYIS